MYTLPIAAIIDALTEHGFYVTDEALPLSLIKDLKEIAIERENSNRFKLAGTGKGATISQLRGDKIHWLEADDASIAVQSYLRLLQELQLAMNRHLMMGLLDVETHFALYDVGQAYRTHVDQFASSQPSQSAIAQSSSINPAMKRSVSMILYLNEDWLAHDGGALKLYLDRHMQCPTCDARSLHIVPKAGRMVLFLSDQFWHEVLPAHKPRYSLAAWFRSRA